MCAQCHVSYLYDGSFQGVLCCVFESYSAHEMPAAIHTPDTLEITLFPLKQIMTDEGHFQRVLQSISTKISSRALELVKRCFLTGHPQKELLLLRFLRVGYREGPKAVQMLQNSVVSDMHKAVQALEHEAHLLSGFLRFSQLSGALAAIIEPKNVVLPLMAPHFASRFPEETYIICDKTHGLALFYRPYESRIMPLEELELPPLDEEEMQYRQLWKRFCDTIAIEGRLNPVCQRTLCPKRFWKNMFEMELRPDTPAFPLSSPNDTPVLPTNPSAAWPMMLEESTMRKQ